MTEETRFPRAALIVTMRARRAQRHRADQVGQARPDHVADSERRMAAREREHDNDQLLPLAAGSEQTDHAL